MGYYDMIKVNARRFTGDEAVMWASIKQVDDLLESIKEDRPELYWAFMRSAHEAMCGKHYDAAYAKWQVNGMSHEGADGREYKGEHWSLEQTNAVFSKFRNKVPSTVNEYDFYVALNASWHDFGIWAKEKFDTDTEIEVAIVELTIAFWFNDHDCNSEGKVWDYFSRKNNTLLTH